jgi:hypothetical protein
MWKLIFVYLLLFCVGRDLLLRKVVVEATLSQKQIAQAVRVRRGKTETDGKPGKIGRRGRRGRRDTGPEDDGPRVLRTVEAIAMVRRTGLYLFPHFLIKVTRRFSYFGHLLSMSLYP